MSVIEDWYSLDSMEESGKKLQTQLDCQGKQIQDLTSQLSSQSKEIEDLKRIVQQLSSELISQLSVQQQLSKEVSFLKQNTHIKHTNELLEELKILKQRELNLLIREKIPTPFSASTDTILTRKTLL